MKPIRVRLSRAKGWRMPPNTVKVDRTTKWGNPFRADGEGPDGMSARDYAAQKFSYMASGFICCCAKPSMASQEAYLYRMMRDISELAGKNLACWCPLDKPCHADTLLKAAQVYATRSGQRTRSHYLKRHAPNTTRGDHP
jgi:hypothetical protein